MKNIKLKINFPWARYGEKNFGRALRIWKMVVYESCGNSTKKCKQIHKQAVLFYTSNCVKKQRDDF